MTMFYNVSLPMVIRKIEICNFRIFYKDNAFELLDGLNLILGWHGDGKTTFFDALDWLFRTDGTNKMDTKYISKKRIEELFSGDSDNVRVAMTYEHKGKVKVLEKAFRFTKSFDDEVGTTNYTFTLTEQNGEEVIVKDGFSFDKDVSSDIRKFIMFKGDADLDVLRSSNALKIFVDNFSDVKAFDAYSAFMEYATKKADQARDNAQKMDKKNEERYRLLKRTIDSEIAVLADIEREIKIKENEAINFDNLLRSIEQSNESSKLLMAVNRRIESLSQKRAETASRIREDYSFRLLQDMWVLMGFEEIADEFSYKVYKLGKERRRLEQTNIVEIGETNDANPIYEHNYVSSLLQQDAMLDHSLEEIRGLRQNVQKTIVFNERLHDDIKKIDANLALEFEQKKRLLSQADGISEEQLLANYANISDWMDKKSRAENRIDLLKRQKAQHRIALDDAQMTISKMSEGTSAAIFAKTSLIIRQISNAFKAAKDENKKRLLCQIEDVANEYLKRLYPYGYTGIIRILEKMNGQAEVALMNDDHSRLFYSGCTLSKAYLFSVILAIKKLVSEKDSTELPLIFDGSNSCLGTSWSNCLFDSTGGQMIVITSDYLKMNNSGEVVLDCDSLPRLHSRVYRMEKKTPFDRKKLGTMQVCISRIK